MWETSVITSAGLSLLRRWSAGGTMTIDGAKVGRGTVAVEEAADSVALVEEMQTASIAGYDIVDGGVRYKIVIKSPERGYIANQVGIWGHLDDGESVLIALYQDEDGVDIPSVEEMPEFEYNLFALITMSAQGGELKVTLDPALAVSRKELDRLREAFESHEASCHGWHHGSGVTGTSTEGLAFSGSGVDAAREGDFYLNTDTGNVYRCVIGGGPETALWRYEGNIRGSGSGSSWTEGGVLLGSRWYDGTGVTGTSPEGTAFPGSGVESAAEGECYLNTLTGNVYRCVHGGGPEAALWKYVLCLRGPEGEQGPQGNVNVSFGVTDLDEGVSALESGLLYFVYEGAAVVKMGLPTESLIGVPLRAAGMSALSSVAVSASDASTVWYDGVGVTGTPDVGTVYPDSGVANARVGDFYKHSGTGRLYRCAKGGGPEEAQWVFLMDLHGKEGPKGATGGLYVQVSTEPLTPGESDLEAGKMYVVYDGAGVIAESRSWYANVPVAAQEDDARGYNHAGSVQTYAELPEGAAVGDVYDVRDTGMNYRWDGQRWDELGARMDVATDAEADAMLKETFGE